MYNTDAGAYQIATVLVHVSTSNTNVGGVLRSGRLDVEHIRERVEFAGRGDGRPRADINHALFRNTDLRRDLTVRQPLLLLRRSKSRALRVGGHSVEGKRRWVDGVSG